MKKIDIKIPLIIVLLIIYVTMCIKYFEVPEKQTINFNNFWNISGTRQNKERTIFSTSSQVSSALIEKIELHATYYLGESYIEVGDRISSGSKIIKYTNGTDFYAPYDCVITEINIPSINSKITNNNYVKISSINSLMVEFQVNESIVKNLSIGKASTITIEALNDKKYDGVITNISNTANNGRFTVKVEFDNDGEVMLGMTAKISI